MQGSIESFADEILGYFQIAIFKVLGGRPSLSGPMESPPVV
jgi:hypothetical protein